MIDELYPNLLPAQMAAHYGFPPELTGRGQKIAVISLGGKVDEADLQSAFQAMNIALPSIKVVDVDSDSISLKQDFMSAIETLLDVSVVGSICPDAAITVYRGANPHGFALAVEQAIADQNNVISISWTLPEQDGAVVSVLENALQQAAEQGITVCAATGDGGAGNSRDIKGAAGPAADGQAHVTYPASSPLVLACGGTKLVDNEKESYEVVWNNAQGATGGGVSACFPLPNWQQDFQDIKSVNNGENGRIIPDVSALASAGDWSIFHHKKQIATGGTSAVAPLWASFVTLVNEARSQAGKAPLGFLNERLYALAQRETVFTPVTQGNNRPNPTYPGYEATSDFNACCGLGIPIGKELFNALYSLE